MNDFDTEELVPNDMGPPCPCFVAFLRLLLKYLQHRDGKAHAALRRRLQVCTEKARRHEPGYECVAKAVLDEIPEVVKLSDLRRVQAILRARKELRLKKLQQQAQNDDETLPTGQCGKLVLLNDQNSPTGSQVKSG